MEHSQPSARSGHQPTPGAPAGQRRRRADGERTRETILGEAARLATLVGLEGLTIGGLAEAVGMSKSGLYAHFGSKQGLQLATIAEARRVFDREVIQPALAAPPGRAQILALCEAFFDHLRKKTFPGGCFFAGAVLEMGTRPGPVRDRIADFQLAFTGLVRQLVATAIAQGEVAASTHPDALTFELNGVILAADAAFVLRDDPAVLDLAAAVVHVRLAAHDPAAQERRQPRQASAGKAKQKVRSRAPVSDLSKAATARRAPPSHR